MQLIAHRGLTDKDIRENTLKSFSNALNNGYDGIELDIRKTKDNKIVVHHDYLINRTSNGKGILNKYTYKELKKYNFGSNKYPEKLPLLENIIKSLNNTIIFIELKEEIAQKELINILNKNRSNTYYICSFNKKYLEEFINIKYNVGLINNIFNSKIDYTKYNFIMILENIFNEKIYNEFKKIDIEVVLYGVLNNISLNNKKIIQKIKYII